MIDIKTDITRFTRWPVILPSDWDFSKPLENGEWVTVNNDRTISRITADATTLSTFPVWTEADRADVIGSESITVIIGPMIAITDLFVQGTGNTAVVYDSLLKVTGDTDNPGRLARATSGDLVRGHVMEVAADGATITFRLIDGAATAA